MGKCHLTGEKDSFTLHGILRPFHLWGRDEMKTTLCDQLERWRSSGHNSDTINFR